MNEAMRLLLLYAFMAWTRTTLLITFTSTFPTYSSPAFNFSPHMCHIPCWRKLNNETSSMAEQ
jgi:hypothetical protein